LASEDALPDAQSPLRFPFSLRLALVGIAIAAAVVAAVLGTRLWLGQRAPLAFEVGPAESSWPAAPPEPGVVGRWLTAPAQQALPLRFSDGSTIRLRPDARGSVVAVAPRGAGVVLERGAAHASIVHKERTRWDVLAGPFEIRVVGTAFEFAWDPQKELFTLRLEQGAVTVSGCALPEERAVATGETFRAVCHGGHVALPKPEPVAAATDATPDGGAAEPPAAEVPLPLGADAAPLPSGADAAPLPSPPSAAWPKAAAATRPSAAPRLSSPSSDAATPPSGLPAVRSLSSDESPPDAASPGLRWQDLLARGRFGEAVDAAAAQGWAQVCATAEAKDLMSLANAARYVGHSDEADLVLHRVRERFPHDDRASVAAFDLGRIAFDETHSYLDAARWFETYLAERPTGPLAREALGRFMEALERGGAHVRAREAAGRYLGSFPRGPHADLARSIMAE
jgi:hypothetical protein